MEENIQEIEVTPVSISVRGKWSKQISGEVPDFTNLKFSVKYSDKSTLKYEDWDSFNKEGGRYSVPYGTKWAPLEDTQIIVFFIEGFYSVQKSVSLPVVRKVKEISLVSQDRRLDAGKSINLGYLNLRVRYTDNSYKEGKEVNHSLITVNPQIIPIDSSDSYPCEIIYTENDFEVSSVINILVEPKVYTATIISDGNKGSAYFIRNGKKVMKFSFGPKDIPFEVELLAEPINDSHRISYWRSSIFCEISGLCENHAFLKIPKELTSDDINVSVIWDKKRYDKYGNIFLIEDKELKEITLNYSDVEIPDDVISIKRDVFKELEISSIKFNNHLRFIEDSAFERCSITNIEFPASLESIGECSFEGCTNLKSIVFKSTNPIVIGRAAFRGCGSLSTLDFLSMGRRFKECVFGDGVNKDVWEGCSLRRVLLTKENFSSVIREKYSDKNITSRSAGGFKVRFRSPEDKFYIRVIGTTERGYSDEISADLDRGYSYESDKTLKEISFKSYSHIDDVDFRESCGIYLTSQGAHEMWVESLGLGYPDFNYDPMITFYSNYRFTTNGGDDVIHEDDSILIGNGFDNWNMMSYVNDVLYPNIKLGEDSLSDKDFDESTGSHELDKTSGTLIDLMIPIYNLRLL